MAPIIFLGSLLLSPFLPVTGLVRIPTICLCLITGLIFQLLYQLHVNIQIAKSTGLPYILTPIYQFGLYSFAIGETAWFKRFVRRLPFGLGRWIDWTLDHYKWRRRRAEDTVYNSIGSDVYIAVSPGGLLVNIANPEVVVELTMKRSMIQKPSDGFLDVLNIFGENVFTASEDEWPRHRKFVSGTFNEKNYAQVWRTTIDQACQCLSQWTSPSSSTERDPTDQSLIIKDMFNDLQNISLNVIASVALGAKLPFGRKDLPAGNGVMTFSNSTPEEGRTLPFRESIIHIAMNFIKTFLLTSLVPRVLYSHVSQGMKYTLTAFSDSGFYLRRLVDKARAEVKDGEIGQNNLLTTLVRQQQLQQVDTDSDPYLKGKRISKVTDADVLGNAYMITIAGFETTAASLHYTLVILALHQKEQAWLFEALDEALRGESEDPTQWDYSTIFPKMIGPLCVMFEMLRLYPPAYAIAKRTSKTVPAFLTLNGKTYPLPPDTLVDLDLVSTHHNTAYWGPNASQFQPWIWDGRRPPPSEIPALSPPIPGVRGDIFPNLNSPKRGTWAPFGEGHRACIGQKFAQVEYVAIIAVLLRSHRVELVREDGEGREEMERRVWKVIETSTQTLSLRMRENVKVRLVARG